MSTEGKDSASWGPAEPTAGISGNARWELLQAARHERIKAEIVVPAYVQLKIGENGRTVGDVIRFLADHPDQYSLSDHEMDSLVTEAEYSRDTAHIHATILCNPAFVDSAEWTVLHVGPPQARIFRGEGSYSGKVLPRKSGPLRKMPVLGIVDDGIGFLHHRFRKPDGATRFQSFWLMHSDVIAGDPGPFNGGATLFGIELTEGDINLRLASNRSEEALYRQVNTGVFGPVPRKSTNHHVGHGTHVLDLAAGAGTGDALACVPLLGVQLPPTSIADTSGRRLDPDIALALRWIINKALQMPGRVPLVINLSLGSLAGPQDGTGVVETAIRYEIARYHFFSGKAPIRVVVAYGNARRARLVAKARLQPQAEVTLDWRILADDATPSYLELRTGKAQAANIAITLRPPNSGPVLSLAGFAAPGPGQQFNVPGGSVAEVADIPHPGMAQTLVTVAKTISDNNLPVAPAGAWRITLRNTGADVATVSLKVQRDDTPGGYRRNGRQSWLDHPLGWMWEDETRALAAPDPTGPITRACTEVAYAGLRHPSVYFVSAARPDPARPDPFVAAPPVRLAARPSRYSAEGDVSLTHTPTVSAMADRGAALTGRPASGVRTGAFAQLSGTSVAAPIASRRLLELAMAGQLDAQPTLGQSHDPVEIGLVLGRPPSPIPDVRIGWGTILEA